MQNKKRKMASKMLTREERKAKIPVFDSEAWAHRKQSIKKRLTGKPKR